MIKWLLSLFAKRCDHRFDYHQVVDLNVHASDIKCIHCSKSFTALAAEMPHHRASFKHVPAGNSHPLYEDLKGYYTIQFIKIK